MCCLVPTIVDRLHEEIDKNMTFETYFTVKQYPTRGWAGEAVIFSDI